MSMRKVNGFPLEIHDANPEEISKFLDLFQGSIREYIRIGPKGYFIPKEYEKHVSNIYNMALRPTDIFVSSYQRSGTTWTQELVWLVANNLDYETAASVFLTIRFTFIDTPMLVTDKDIQAFVHTTEDTRTTAEFLKRLTKKPLEVLASVQDPRFMKTHLPFSLLPPTLLDTAKVVYVVRDPRDVAVSAYHHAKLVNAMGYKGDFKQFWNLFIKDIFILTPYFEHVKEAWALRHHPNMLIIFYEELSKDMIGPISKVCRFLGKIYTEEQITNLSDHLSFKNFKNNNSVNSEEIKKCGLLSPNEEFIRKGKAGGWRDYFDTEMTHQAERWICDNLRNTDLRFPSLDDIHI